MATRDPFAPREVVSRRGGATKQPLSRDMVVEKALELLMRDGLEGMSLRKVAAALDTGAASLYVYVQDLQELQALVLDRALTRVRTGAGRQKPWRERLLAVLGSYVRVLFGNPGLAQLAMRTIATGPNALRLLETLLGILADAGVDETTAAWAVDLLLLHVTAIAAEQSQRDPQTDPLGTIARVIDVVPEADYPRVHRVRKALLSGGGKSRFTWALEVLVEGVLHAPRPGSAPARSEKD